MGCGCPNPPGAPWLVFACREIISDRLLQGRFLNSSAMSREMMGPGMSVSPQILQVSELEGAQQQWAAPVLLLVLCIFDDPKAVPCSSGRASTVPGRISLILGAAMAVGDFPRQDTRSQCHLCQCLQNAEGIPDPSVPLSWERCWLSWPFPCRGLPAPPACSEQEPASRGANAGIPD